MPTRSNTWEKGNCGMRAILLIKQTLPTIRFQPGALVLVSNSTGTMVAINTTGTTWRYLSKTSVLA